MKIAIIQNPPVFLNLDASVGRARTLVEEANSQRADVIVFPETWLPGYPVWLDLSPGAALWDHPPAKELFQVLFENSVDVASDVMERLKKAACDAEAHVVIGAHERVGSTLYNTMIFLHKNGRDFRIHRKLMPTYSERMVWGQGDGSTLRVLETELGNIGGLVCWEHWMPLARAAMHSQDEALHVAQWPMVKEMNLLCSRHYAFEGQCFVAAAGCALTKGEMLEGYDSVAPQANRGRELLEEIPGDGGDLVLKGGSAVIAPSGELIAGPLHDEATIMFADLDLGFNAQGKLFLDTDGHYARPDILQLAVNAKPLESVTFTSSD